MSQDVGEAFTKRMMPDLLPYQQKKMLHDVLGEVANMISGMASIKLAGDDDTINITPPVVIRGESEFDFLKVPTIVVLLDSTIGSLEINIAFKETPAR